MNRHVSWHSKAAPVLALIVVIIILVSRSSLAFPESTASTAPAPVSSQAVHKSVHEDLYSLGKAKTITWGSSMGGILAATLLTTAGAIAVRAEGDSPAGMAVMTSGIILGGLTVSFGPSMGHMYARNWGQAFITSGVRLVSGTLGVGFLFGGLMSGYTVGPCEGESDCGNDSVAAEPLYVGSALFFTAFVGSIIYDAATLRKAVHRANERHKIQFGLAPTVIRSRATNANAYGMGISISF